VYIKYNNVSWKKWEMMDTSGRHHKAFDINPRQILLHKLKTLRVGV